MAEDDGLLIESLSRWCGYCWVRGEAYWVCRVVCQPFVSRGGFAVAGLAGGALGGVCCVCEDRLTGSRGSVV